MKFLPALLLVVASVHTSTLPFYGWVPGQEMTYSYQSQVLTGIPEISQSHWSGIKMNAKIIVQSFSDFSLRLRVTEPEFWTINGQGIMLSDTGRVMREQESQSLKVQPISQEFKDYLTDPFLVHMKAGVVESFMVAKDEPASITNIKKSILSQIQIDISPSRPSQLETNRIQIAESEEGRISFYNTMEATVQGECLTEYTIHRLPQWKINELEEAWVTEELKVKDFNIESESEAMKSCQDKPYFLITKTKNLEQCKKVPFYQMNTRSTVAVADVTSNSELGTTLSTTHTYVCGELNEFVVRKVAHKRMSDHPINGYNTDEIAVAPSMVNMSLLKIKPITVPMTVPAATMTISSIVYGFSMEGQQIAGDQQLSQEIIKKTEDLMGLTPQLPQPSLTQAPHNIILSLPTGEMIPKILEQIKMMASEVYQSPESCSAKSDLAGKLSAVSLHMRSLSLTELEQLEIGVKELSEGTSGLKSMQKIFYDTLSLVGTNPSTMLVIKKVKEGSLPITFLTKLVSYTIRNVRYPTQDLMEELVKMIKSTNVRSHKQLYTSVMLQMSNLFYHAYVNPVTMRNNFPTPLFGVFGTKESSVLTEKFIPFLIEEMQRNESEHVRLSAILALGKIGHLKGLKTLVKEIERVAPVASPINMSDKVEAHRVIAMNSLKRIAKLNPTEIRPILMSVIVNPVECAQVKIAAVSVLPFAQPTTTEIQTLAIRSWMEPSRQVSAFIVSTLRSLAHTQVPELKIVGFKARSVLPLIKNEQYGIQYSHNINFSSFVEYLKVLINNQYQLVNSKESLMPHKIVAKTDYYTPSNIFKVKVIDFSAYTYGMDYLLDKYLHFFTGVEQTVTPIKEQLNKIAQELKLKTRELATPFSFAHGSLAGMEASLYLDSEIVLETLEQLTAKFESTHDVEFSHVGAHQIFDASYMYVTETGFPILVTSSLPIIYSVKGSVKVSPMEGKLVPQVVSKIVPVLNGKLQNHYGIISPFTREFIGTGNEMSVHAFLPLEIEGMMTQGQIELSIRVPTEVERSGLVPKIHGFVMPYTFKYNLLAVTPLSHSTELNKIVSGINRQPISMEVGKSLGVSARITYNTDAKFINMYSYLQKIVQHTPLSILPTGIFPSSVRMSSLELELFPAKSQTKVFNIVFRLTTKGMVHCLSQKQVSEEQISPAFSQVKSILSQLEKADVVEITGTTKGPSGSELKKIQAFVVLGQKSNGHLAAAEVYPIGADEAYGLRYEGKIELPKLMNRWNVEKMTEESLKGGFQGELFFGKSSQMESVKVIAELEKTEELKKEIRASPEFKQCMADQLNQDQLSPVCTTVRLQAAVMDKIRLTIHTPSAWSNSYATNLLDSISKVLLLGNVESEKAYPGTMGVTISEARADRVSQIITAKVWTPTREVLLRNIRFMGLARFFLPATALRSPLEVAALKLTGDHIPSTCRVEPSLVRTFDNMTVPYQINDCEHVLVMDGSRKIPVAITTKTAESGKKIVKVLSGINEVQMIPNGAGIVKVMFNGEELTLPGVGTQLVKKNPLGEIQLTVRRFEDAVSIHITEQMLQVLSNGVMVEVVAPQLLKSRTVGLCGDMNGEFSADLKTPAKCVLRPQVAALSFMLNKSGDEVGFERCSGIPSAIKEEFVRETTNCPHEVVTSTTSVVESDNSVSSGLTGQGPPKFRNIGYVLSGYDILTGNPLTKGRPDPGIKAPIFKAVFNAGQTTADGRYSVPNGMDTLSCGGTCNVDFSSSLIAGAKSYQKQLETKVEASFGIPFVAKFSASVGFKKMQQSSKAHSTFFTMTEVTCCTYWVCLNTFTQPEFNNNFKNELDHLPRNYNANEYMRFVSIFGTHYINQARMGALYGEQSTISAESWERMVSKGVNIGAAASYSGKFSIGGSTMTNSQRSEAESFRRETSEQNVYSIGKPPPRNGNRDAWMQGTMEEPQPIWLKLEPMYEMRALKQYLRYKPTVLENIKRAIGGHCQSLKEQGVVSSCEGLPEDPSFPQPSESELLDGCAEADVDYPGHDYVGYPITKGMKTWMNCGRLCARDPFCKYWSWTDADFPGQKNGCWLKNGRGEKIAHQHVVSGKRGCPCPGTCDPDVDWRGPFYALGDGCADRTKYCYPVGCLSDFYSNMWCPKTCGKC